MVAQLHHLLLELIPGGAKKDLSAAQARATDRAPRPSLAQAPVMTRYSTSRRCADDANMSGLGAATSAPVVGHIRRVVSSGRDGENRQSPGRYVSLSPEVLPTRPA